MSHYADLEIGDFVVWTVRNVADPYILVLFTSSEKQEFVEVIDNEPYKHYLYASTAFDFMRRLDIMGFSLKNSEKAFRDGIKEILEMMEVTDEERNFLLSFDFDLWLEAMQLVVEHATRRWVDEKEWAQIEPKIPPGMVPYVQFILGRFPFRALGEIFLERGGFPWEHWLEIYPDGFHLGFLIYPEQHWGNYWDAQASVYHMLRAVLEVFPKDTPVQFDYTSLIEWGTYTPEEDITEAPTEKVIILTEGSSDKEFLERSLKILYPGLQKFFHFLDFHSANLPGGTDSLVRMVKAFISAGIPNRIIALFDNDTAAYEALRGLSKVQLPENIRVLTLPDVPWATNYPTIGPQGENVQVDINGKACSIELFLGENVLKPAEDEWVPVQWTGYSRVLRRYQGELLYKDEVQRRFREILSLVEEGTIPKDEIDWSGMRAIFEKIFSAFA